VLWRSTCFIFSTGFTLRAPPSHEPHSLRFMRFDNRVRSMPSQEIAMCLWSRLLQVLFLVPAVDRSTMSR